MIMHSGRGNKNIQLSENFTEDLFIEILLASLLKNSFFHCSTNKKKPNMVFDPYPSKALRTAVVRKNT